MTIKANRFYRSTFEYRKGKGILIITKKLIIATGIFAVCYR
jgi:hypothetical protein